MMNGIIIGFPSQRMPIVSTVVHDFFQQLSTKKMKEFSQKSEALVYTPRGIDCNSFCSKIYYAKHRYRILKKISRMWGHITEDYIYKERLPVHQRVL